MAQKHEVELLNKMQNQLQPLFTNYHKVHLIGLGFNTFGLEINMYLFLESHENVYMCKIYTNISSRETDCELTLLNKELMEEIKDRLKSISFIIPYENFEISANFHLTNIELVDNLGNVIFDFAYSACFTKDGRDKGLIDNGNFKDIEKTIKKYLK